MAVPRTRKSVAALSPKGESVPAAFTPIRISSWFAANGNSTMLSRNVVLNPTAIFEVLSPSTEVFDRGEKFIRYQKWNPTLRDYVLISQDKPQIEHYRKQEDGTWSYRLHTELESSVAIPSIGCTLKLAEVYERIVFTTLTNTPT